MYALCQDATHKSLSEMLEMSEWDLYATAKLRARYYRELYDD